VQDPNIIGALLNAGVAGLLLFLFVKGWIVPKPTVDRMTRDMERWRKLYDTERAAHELTRKAHAEEVKATLQASVEGSQTTAALLSEMKTRQSEAPR
jgi:hypothetical protein